MALRIALDANRYTDLARGDRELADLLETAEEVFLPFAVLGELRAGFAAGRRGLENERTLQRFLSKPGVEPLFAGDGTTRHYAHLYRQLRSQGTPIPTNDLWIAALVVEHDLGLCSRDGHFRHLPQIVVL
jgi:tRNA(fMet)-specific endonuclease VapC